MIPRSYKQMRGDFVPTAPRPTYNNDVVGRDLLQINTKPLLGVDLSKPLNVQYQAVLSAKPENGCRYLVTFWDPTLHNLELNLPLALDWKSQSPVYLSNKARAYFKDGRHLIHLDIKDCYDSCKISRVIEAQDSEVLKAYLTNLYSNIEDWNYGLISGSTVSTMAFECYLKKIIGKYLNFHDLVYRDDILLVDSDKAPQIIKALEAEGLRINQDKYFDSNVHKDMHIYLGKPIDESHDDQYVKEYVKDVRAALTWTLTPRSIIETAIHQSLFKKGYYHPVDPDLASPLWLMNAWVNKVRENPCLEPFYKFKEPYRHY